MRRNVKTTGKFTATTLKLVVVAKEEKRGKCSRALCQPQNIDLLSIFLKSSQLNKFLARDIEQNWQMYKIAQAKQQCRYQIQCHPFI